MRGNHEGQPEILDPFQHGEQYFGLVQLERTGERKRFGFGVSREGYLALKRWSGDYFPRSVVWGVWSRRSESPHVDSYNFTILAESWKWRVYAQGSRGRSPSQ